MKMIRVGQYDLGAEVQQIAWRDGPDRATCADRHEGRRLDIPMCRTHLAAPCSVIMMSDPELECGRHWRILSENHFSFRGCPFPSNLQRHVTRLRIGVVYGGRSSEHEVSLASAAAVISNLDPTRYEAVPIHIDKRGRWALADRPPTADRRWGRDPARETG